jgi:DnaD/phage-associated family protein
VDGRRDARTGRAAPPRGDPLPATERFFFPAGARATFVPSLFFSEVLPRIEDPAELVVTMYLFYALGRRRSYPRTITRQELAAEAPLRRALARLEGGIEPALARGLEAAVARGTVLRARMAHAAQRSVAEDREAEVYLLHTEAARAALRSARLLGLEPVPAAEPLPDEPPPSIFALYEENIGTIAPLIAEDLREVEAAYPPAWIVAAFKEAVSMNKRNWRYIVRILERWRAEGRSDATVGRDFPGHGRGRDLEGRYRKLVRR